MPSAVSRKSRGKKPAKDNTSRQTSLLDVFTIRSSSKKATPITSAVHSENTSTAGDEIIDISSSDVDPLTEQPVDSSSPIAAEEDEGEKDVGSVRAEVKFGSANQGGGSRDAPIVVADSSPIASPVTQARTKPSIIPPPPPKALFSIFAPRKRPDERESSPSKLSGKPPPTPFPDHASQHVRGPQSGFSVPLTEFARRDAPCIRPNAEVDASVYSRLSRSSETAQTCTPSGSFSANVVDPSETTIRDRCISSIPLHHRQYPAISHLLDQRIPSTPTEPGASGTSNLLWNDKWRPKRADQVLGNEQSALYLRDWLLALKLHIHSSGDATGSAIPDKKGKPKSSRAKAKAKGPRGTKRPRIIRDVQRKRRRLDSEEPEESWIADDCDSDSSNDPLDLIFASEDDFIGNPVSRIKRRRDDDALTDSESLSVDEASKQSSGPSSSNGVNPFSYRPPKFGDEVCNTILLAGPSGCGKTAAVYACAEELGWEVFEVYPGIGERSGAALQKLIGEVGKNHLVKQTQPKAKAEKEKANVKTKRDFFTKRVVSDDEAEAPAADEVQDEHVCEPPKPEPVEVRQSIILVEEVDVLYREDANFWPTMAKIIKECRRPVVMTCNDPHLVPAQDLPLQTTLHFAPGPIPLAASYLRLRCLLEGFGISAASAIQLYECLGRYAAQHERRDDALHPRRIPQAPPDLRRTINQLQFGTSYLCEDKLCSLEETRQDQSLQGLRRLAWSLELCSFADSELRRPAYEVLRDSLENSASPCADDVLGFRHLSAGPSDTSSYLPVTFSTYHRDETILDDLLSYAKQHYPVPDDLVYDTPDPVSLHTPHCGTLVPILDRLRISREDLIRNSRAIFLDYEPWIRYMVHADDAHIAANLTSGQYEGTTRRTRNSQRAQWELQRWVCLKEDERGILNRTAFEVDADDGTTATKPEPASSS